MWTSGSPDLATTTEAAATVGEAARVETAVLSSEAGTQRSDVESRFRFVLSRDSQDPNHPETGWLERSGGGGTLDEIRAASRALVGPTAAAAKASCLREREALLEKKFRGGGLSSREERRLAMVLWRLDRIDDAEQGASLDRLEGLARIYAQFRDDMASIQRELIAKAH